LEADTVFAPWRLQKMLSTQPVSWSGIYIENCAEAKHGFFGPIEVISHQAFATPLKQLDGCSLNIRWASMHATSWGPIGEDLSAQKCMDKHGVSKILKFELTTDGVCPSVENHKKYPKALKPDCTYRYVDWILIVPLLLFELILVMKLPEEQTNKLCWNLGTASAILVALGYPGAVRRQWWFLATKMGISPLATSL